MIDRNTALVVGLVVSLVAVMAGIRVASAVREPEARASALAEPPPPPPTPAAATGTVPARSPDPSPAPDPALGTSIADEMKLVPVTVYAADYCPWCRKAKAHLEAQGIAYSERRIDVSPDAKREMDRIGGRGIPTIDIEGEVHSGYDPSWVERTLRAHATRRVAARRGL